jgi:hypothetical protein
VRAGNEKWKALANELVTVALEARPT